MLNRMLIVAALSGLDLLNSGRLTRAEFEALPKRITGKGTGKRYRPTPYAGPYKDTQANARRKRQLECGILKI